MSLTRIEVTLRRWRSGPTSRLTSRRREIGSECGNGRQARKGSNSRGNRNCRSGDGRYGRARTERPTSRDSNVSRSLGNRRRGIQSQIQGVSQGRRGNRQGIGLIRGRSRSPYRDGGNFIIGHGDPERNEGNKGPPRRALMRGRGEKDRGTVPIVPRGRARLGRTQPPIPSARALTLWEG